MVAVCNYYMVDSVSRESQEEGGGKVHRWHRSSPLLLLLVAVNILVPYCSLPHMHLRYIATLLHRYIDTSLHCYIVTLQCI